MKSLLKATIKSVEEILENPDREERTNNILNKHYNNMNIISTDFKEKNFFTKIESSWEKKTPLVVSIDEDTVENGDFFEINPRNSNTKEEFIEKIEELLFINVILQRKSSGTVEFNNGTEITNVKYHNAVEKKELEMLSIALKSQNVI